jgi:FMN reductase
LPIATGGTIAHLLSLEYAFKPVFSVLGSNEILNGVYLIDSQIGYKENGLIFSDAGAEERLLASLEELIKRFKKAEVSY